MNQPGFRFSTILLVALSLSIGWGIRGNFGHEYGAMIPGALAAIAVCLFSGREDWRRRVAFFAFFGAVGWGFGGSISYGQVIAYSHSGQLATQAYGFAALFVIGFLWAGLGGAGTALPAVATREQLTELFRPLLVIFGVWWAWEMMGGDVVRLFAQEFDTGDYRHRSPLYWFDTDWIEALTALFAVCLFDLWDRRVNRENLLVKLSAPVAIGAVIAYGLFDISLRHFTVAAVVYITAIVILDVWKNRIGTAFILGALALAGAGFGFITQWMLEAAGFAAKLSERLTRYLGDQELFRPEAIETLTTAQRELVEGYGGNGEAFRAELYTNWPPFVHFENFTPHLGWILGLLLGVAVFFWKFGKFRSGSRLYLYMCLGWFAGFLLFPVLLDWRMTPPRSDSWAGTAGLFVATMLYLLQYRLAPVAYASMVSGAIGGVGFSGAAFLKLMMVRFGNPNVVEDTEVIKNWAHWQSANWHSFLEQTYGFINGIGIAVAMGLLATRVWTVDFGPRVRRWTEPFCVGFVLLFVVFVNWRKAVETWISQEAVPESMRMPWFDSIEFSAHTWFTLVFWIVGFSVIALFVRHMWTPLAFIPPSWLGRGQLLFLVFLWIAVIFNNERALTGFREGRLITEAVIFVNAALATVLLLAFARDRDDRSGVPALTKQLPFGRMIMVAFATLLIAVAVETTVTRVVYGGARPGHAGDQLRFGPDAAWRIDPLLKTRRHN